VAIGVLHKIHSLFDLRNCLFSFTTCNIYLQCKRRKTKFALQSG